MAKRRSRSFVSSREVWRSAHEFGVNCQGLVKHCHCFSMLAGLTHRLRLSCKKVRTAWLDLNGFLELLQRGRRLGRRQVRVSQAEVCNAESGSQLDRFLCRTTSIVYAFQVHQDHALETLRQGVRVAVRHRREYTQGVLEPPLFCQYLCQTKLDVPGLRIITNAVR